MAFDSLLINTRSFGDESSYYVTRGVKTFYNLLGLSINN